MNISELTQKMIAFSQGDLHDINHFMKVWAYARTIGEGERLDPETQFILEAAALTHDIACPFCREKYGNTNGPYQEQEGMVLVREFLRDTDLSPERIQRIIYLVGHHHTFEGIQGLDYQILVEADFLVNAEESRYSHQNIRTFCDRVFRTETGRRLLKAIYRL